MSENIDVTSLETSFHINTVPIKPKSFPFNIYSVLYIFRAVLSRLLQSLLRVVSHSGSLFYWLYSGLDVMDRITCSWWRKAFRMSRTKAARSSVSFKAWMTGSKIQVVVVVVPPLLSPSWPCPRVLLFNVITLTTKSSCSLVARINENRRSGSSGSNCVNERLPYKTKHQTRKS